MITARIKDTNVSLRFPDGTEDAIISKTIREYFHGFKTQLTPDEESGFKTWYADKAKQVGIDPDPDHPAHMYDYRGSWKEGRGPELADDKEYHWPSRFKHPDHPNRFVDGIDTLTEEAEKEIPEAAEQAGKRPWYQGVRGGPAGRFTPEAKEKPAGTPDLTAGRLASQAFRATSEGGADILRFMEQSQRSRDIEAEVGDPFIGADVKTMSHLADWTKKFESREGRNPTAQERAVETIRWKTADSIKQADALKATIDKFPKLLEGSSGLAEDAIVGLFRFLPSMSISFASAGVGTAFTFVQIAGMKADEYAKQGIDPKRGMESAVISALVQTPLEMFGNLLQIGALKNLVKTFKLKGAAANRVGAFAETLLKGTVVEGIEEFLQQYPDEIANIYAKSEGKSMEEIWGMVNDQFGEITNDALRAALVGAIGGAMLAGAGGVVSQALVAKEDIKRFNKNRAAMKEFFDEQGLPVTEDQLDDIMRESEKAAAEKVEPEEAKKPPIRPPAVKIPKGVSEEKAPVKMKAERVAEITKAAETKAKEKAAEIKKAQAPQSVVERVVIPKVIPEVKLAPAQEKQAILDLQAEYPSLTPEVLQKGLPAVKVAVKETKAALQESRREASIGRTLTTKQVRHIQWYGNFVSNALKKAGASKEVLAKIKVSLEPVVKLDPAATSKSLAQHAKLGTISKEAAGVTDFLENGEALIRLATDHTNLNELEKTVYHEMYHIYKRWVLTPDEVKTLSRHYKNEEAEAGIFADLASRKDDILPSKPPSVIKKLLLKLRRMLQIVSNGLRGRGFKRPQDIFGRLLIGSYRGHFVGPQKVVETKLALRVPTQQAHEFDDPVVEARVSGMENFTRPSAWERAKDKFTELKNKATREFEFLPKVGRWAQLRFDLLKLSKQRGIITPKLVTELQDVTYGLDKVDMHNFTRKVFIDDQYETMKIQEERGEEVVLRGGLDKDSVTEAKKQLSTISDGNPAIKAALIKRKKLWDETKSRYISAMKAIGYNVEKHLNRDAYFRNQVIDHLDSTGLYGTGGRLRTPAAPSFLKRRTASDKDILVNYLQVENEVLSQMYYDIEIANTIASVDRNYNEISQFKMAANSINKSNMFEHLEEVAATMKPEEGKEPITAQKLWNLLNVKMAIGFDKMGQLAAAGDLPLGNNHQWEGFVEALAENWAENKALKRELGKDYTSAQRIPLRDPYASQLIQYANWVLKTHGGEAGSGAAATIFKGIRERRAAMQEALGRDWITWQDLVRDDPNYGTWQPRQGSVFYNATTVQDQLAEQLLDEALQDLKISAQDRKQIRQVRAIGGKRREFVLPNEVIATLDNLITPKKSGIHKKMIKAWKVWQLIMPWRWLKYNIRNLTGDADALFAGNPAAFKKAGRATTELLAGFKNNKPTADLQDWIDRGGMGTLLQAQEIGDLDDLVRFGRDALVKSGQKSLANIPIKAWNGYWKAARVSTDIREAVLRYAAYLDYLESMKKDPKGNPKNFGASIPEEIMGLDDIKDRAFWLSNDLLGAYDRVSAFGQLIREHVMPFWSWKEVNLRRYKQLMSNAASNKKIMEAIGRKAVGPEYSKIGIFAAIRIGSFVFKASALWAMLEVWNRTVFPDEEEELPDDIKGRPHITLGRDSDGKVMYFSRLGAVGDLMEWVGLDTAPGLIDDIFKGKKTIRQAAREQAKESLQALPNVVVQGALPFIKLGGELVLRQSLFPDVFKPRVIRDRMIHAMRAFGLENEYKALMDAFVHPIPSRKYLSTETARKVALYAVDPFEAAYHDMQSEKRRFMKGIGKYGHGFWISPTGSALYNARLSLRYKDVEALNYYLNQYAQLGGTKEGWEQSLERMHPLGDMIEEDKTAFIKSLTAEDLAKFAKAMLFYQQLITGVDARDILESKKRGQRRQ